MTVNLQSTDKIVTLVTPTGEVQCRVWEGYTAAGVACHAFIPRIACKLDADAKEFERDLKETRTPTADVAAIPLRLIL
jgi:hypothetical protein